MHREFLWAGHRPDPQRLSDSTYTAFLTGLCGQEEAVNFFRSWFDARPFIEVQSSGTTGTPKKIRLQKVHMLESARRSVRFFGLSPSARGLMVLPAAFIGGKMQLLRAMISGMHLDFLSPALRLEVGADSYWDFVSLTPHMAALNPDLLPRVGSVLIGGAQVPPALISQLRLLGVKAYESYGSTETLSHVALRSLSPETDPEFHALPGVEFGRDQRGCLRIHSPGIGLRWLTTNDIIELIDPYRFVWTGRWDFVINSGGIKLQPEKIERVLAGCFDCRLLVVPRPEPVLGHEAVLVLERDGITGEDRRILQTAPGLGPYERPRDIIGLMPFPMNTGGKVDRKAVARIIQSSEGNRGLDGSG